MSKENDTLREALTTAFDEFIVAFAAFDENVINLSPTSGGWTPVQVAVHIILATDGVPDGSSRPVDRKADMQLPAIRPWWEDLNQKFDSPESLIPDSRPRTKAEVINELHRVRTKDLAILETQDLTIICLDVDLPMIGFLTRYEWLWFIQIHLRRHTYQLRNIKYSG